MGWFSQNSCSGLMLRSVQNCLAAEEVLTCRLWTVEEPAIWKGPEKRQYSQRSKDEPIRQSTLAWTSWKAPKSLLTTAVFRIIPSVSVSCSDHRASIRNSIKILLVLALINSDCISQNGLFHWKHLHSNMSAQDSLLAFITLIIAEFSWETVVSHFKSRSFDGIWCSVSFRFKF